MGAAELQPEIEFQGVEQYAQATEALFQHAAAVGFVVIRECFNPKSNPESFYGARGRFHEQPLYHVVPSLDEQQASQRIIKQNWDVAGYMDTPLKPSHPNVLPTSRRIHALNHHLTYGTIVQGIASFNGWQELCVSPGVALTEPGTRALSAEAIALDHIQMAAQIKKSKSSEQAYHRSFEHTTTLLPGDVALVMGHPRPAYATLAPNQLHPVSIWGNFRYSMK